MIEGRDDEFRATIRYYFNKRLGHDPNAEQMAAYLEAARHGWTGADIDANLAKEPEAIAYANRPKYPPAPDVYVSGGDLLDRRTGARTSLNGCDAFTAFRDLLDGKDLTPFLDEWNAFGFQVARVFMAGSIAQNGVMQLNPADHGDAFYEAIPAFETLLLDRGVLPLLTAYVDNQDLKLGPAHWQRIAAASTRSFLSGGNERTKNGFDAAWMTDPGGDRIWSKGSDVGDAMPVQPPGTFAEFHPRRDMPAALLDTIASPVYIALRGVTCPLGIDEPPRMGPLGSGDEFAQPRLVHEFATVYSEFCAFAIYHNYRGQRGQLLQAADFPCAAAWSAGMRRA